MPEPTCELDALYPSLASVARGYGSTSLADLASKGHAPGAEFLSLPGSCAWVSGGLPRAEQVADPYGYLKTIEVFLSTFDEHQAPRDKLWLKLKNEGRSQFLDTIAEWSVAVEFHRRGVSLELERPFHLGKDADLVVKLATGDFWFDVIAIRSSASSGNEAEQLGEEEELHEVTSAFLPERSDEVIRRKIRTKYETKFSAALAAGALPSGNVGVMLCMFKAQEDFLTALLPNVAVPLKVPSSLWKDCPGLGAIGVFDLRKPQGEDLLVPVTLLKAALEIRPA